MIGFHVLSGAHPFTQTSVKNPSLPGPGKNMLTGVERTAAGLYPAYSVFRFDTSRGLHFPTRDFSLQLEGKTAQALQQSPPYKLPPPNGRHSRHTVTLNETSLAGRYSTMAKANKMPPHPHNTMTATISRKQVYPTPLWTHKSNNMTTIGV